MKLGMCAGAAAAGMLKEAGYDFLEEHVQNLLQGQVSDAEWKGAVLARGSALPVVAANCLVPGAMKLVGPTADLDALRAYMKTVVKRARGVGIDTLVFGSGAARTVPEGWDREAAKKQILEFLKMAAPLAAENGVMIVVEPLNRKECNIINGLGEAMEYVRGVNSPAVKCLVDSFHLWLENDSLEELRKAMPWIAHVHVSDVEGRRASGESGVDLTGAYRAFFAVIKEAKYDGRVCVEALWPEGMETSAKRVGEFVRRMWGNS